MDNWNNAYRASASINFTALTFIQFSDDISENQSIIIIYGLSLGKKHSCPSSTIHIQTCFVDCCKYHTYQDCILQFRNSINTNRVCLRLILEERLPHKRWMAVSHRKINIEVRVWLIHVGLLFFIVTSDEILLLFVMLFRPHIIYTYRYLMFYVIPVMMRYVLVSR